MFASCVYHAYSCSALWKLYCCECCVSLVDSMFRNTVRMQSVQFWCSSFAALSCFCLDITIAQQLLSQKTHGQLWTKHGFKPLQQRQVSVQCSLNRQPVTSKLCLLRLHLHCCCFQQRHSQHLWLLLPPCHVRGSGAQRQKQGAVWRPW